MKKDTLESRHCTECGHETIDVAPTKCASCGYDFVDTIWTDENIPFIVAAMREMTEEHRRALISAIEDEWCRWCRDALCDGTCMRDE